MLVPLSTDNRKAVCRHVIGFFPWMFEMHSWRHKYGFFFEDIVRAALTTNIKTSEFIPYFFQKVAQSLKLAHH